MEILAACIDGVNAGYRTVRSSITKKDQTYRAVRMQRQCMNDSSYLRRQRCNTVGTLTSRSASTLAGSLEMLDCQHNLRIRQQ